MNRLLYHFSFSLDSRLYNRVGHEAPVVIWLRVNHTHALNLLHEIVALVFLATIYDTAFETIVRDAGTTS